MEQLLLEPAKFNSNNFEPGWTYACPGQADKHPVLSFPGALAGSIPWPTPFTHHRAKSTKQSNIDRLSKDNNDITALYNIGVAVGSSLNLKEIIWTLYKESGHLINTTNFAIALYDTQTDILDFCLVFNGGQEMESFSLKHSNNRGLTSRVLTSQVPLLVPDLAETQAVAEIGQNHSDKHSNQETEKPVRSWLGVPILNPNLADERAQGVIITWSNEPHAISERDLWLLSAIGTQAAIAIRNVRLFQARQRQTTEITAINNVAHTLASTLDLEEALARIMEQIEGMLNAEAGFLFLTDPATNDLVFQIALGNAKREKRAKPFRIPKGQGIAGEVALTGQARRVTEEEGRLDFQARNILCAPLVLHQQIIGVIEIINKKAGNFTQHDLALLNSIASFAAIAIENARLHESVLAERDRVIEAEEQARKALAGDLHDGPVQLVAGMMMRLDFCQAILEKDPARLAKELTRTKKMGEQVMHQMRSSLFELRPLTLETDGLEAALKIFLETRQADIAGDQSPHLALDIESNRSNGHFPRQDSKIETAIFAIVQETVNNALKHAQANKITVSLKETGTGLYTTITDDGQGFDVSQVLKNYEQRGSLGMVNIRERTELIGGELWIESASGQGTQIKIYVPKAKEERLRKRGKTGRLTLPPELMENRS